MKAQTILSQIKEVIGINLNEEVKVELQELTLENGTVLVSDSFEKGKSVFIKSEDEEKIALPVGSYTLEDGRELLVKEEGLIESISAKEAKEEVEASEESVTEEKVEETEMEEHEEEKEEKKEEMYVTKEEFALAMDELKSMIEKLKDHKEEMSSKEKEEVELSEEVAEPIVHNPEAKTESNIFYNSNIAPKSTLQEIYELFKK
tara:strand:+ start:608 stop:1219 length:612 start_codon:yes stop_codon:yes gene_type:complete